MFASSKPCPGEVRNEMFVYSKKFSSNCDYWRGLLRHVSNVLNGEYNIWRWCLLVPTSFGKHLPALSQITNGHLKVVSILKCVDACLSTKLLLTGMMSSKDPTNILPAKIFADQGTAGWLWQEAGLAGQGMVRTEEVPWRQDEGYDDHASDGHPLCPQSAQ